MTNVSFAAAFIAGVFSIASPCVLPLVPVYLMHITGVAVGDTQAASRRSLLLNGLAYVLGFSVVFVALGAAVGAAGAIAGGLDFFNSNRFALARLGGLLVILLGLHQIGVLRIPFLQRTHKFNPENTKPGQLGSSFLIGVTFGAGWSPCVGPILGAILALAAGQGTIERGTVLLAVYSLGLGVPFLAAALAFGSVPNLLRSLNSRVQMLTTVSGAVMLAVGIIMVLGIYDRLFIEIIRVAPWTTWEPNL